MKVCCGVVLYNPTKDDINRIVEYSQSFEKVLLYDNSPVSIKNSELLNNTKIVYTNNLVNDGICIAINQLIEYCINNNYDFLCILDQDSIFKYDDINKMIMFINKKYSDKIALYSPTIKYKHIDSKKQTLNDCFETEWVITSGSFINLSIVNKYNIRYDEKYFIDRCDLDFCKQIRNKGFKIVVNNHAYLYQELGSVGNSGFPEHSALRHYYMFRNRFYFNKKYYSLLKRIVLNIVQTINHLRTILFYESNKLKKCKQLVFAVYDYINNISGRCRM